MITHAVIAVVLAVLASWVIRDIIPGDARVKNVGIVVILVVLVLYLLHLFGVVLP